MAEMIVRASVTQPFDVPLRRPTEGWKGAEAYPVRKGDASTDGDAFHDDKHATVLDRRTFGLPDRSARGDNANGCADGALPTTSWPSLWADDSIARAIIESNNPIPIVLSRPK